MKKSILRMVWTVVITVMFCILYMTCNDSGAGSGNPDPRADEFVKKFNRPSESGSGNDSYETVIIGGKKWMTKNLNVETVDSWCYENSMDSCAKYGRLYTWDAAMTACQLIGLRLPFKEEWEDLVSAVGGENIAGKKLKSTRGWDDFNGNNGNGTDEFGFSALQGGYHNSGDYSVDVGKIGYWWTATELVGSHAYRRNIYYKYDKVYEDNYFKIDGFSVRCVKND